MVRKQTFTEAVRTSGMTQEQQDAQLAHRDTVSMAAEVDILLDRALKAEAMLALALEAGVFGYSPPAPIKALRDLDPEIVGRVEEICEDHGFGYVMQIAESAWDARDPGHGHSVAGCGVVRREWCERAAKLLGR